MSTICLVVSTLPEFSKTEIKIIGQNSSEVSHEESIQNLVFEMIENVGIVWFTVEYILRLISAPRPLFFIREFLNIVDILSIAPFYLTLILTSIFNSHNDKLESISRVVQVFRVLRILRILKLARHSVGLQSLGYTLQKSYKELGLLVSFIAIGVSIFSSLIYYAENNRTTFPSIPATFWMAIISMTTVGYGDICPESALGQTFASICCVTGVLVISMPIPIIVSNFSEFYKDKLRIEKTLKRREELEKLQVFAQNTITVIKPFLKKTVCISPLMKIKPIHEDWDTEDWKFIDYTSSESETGSDETPPYVCKPDEFID